MCSILLLINMFFKIWGKQYGWETLFLLFTTKDAVVVFNN